MKNARGLWKVILWVVCVGLSTTLTFAAGAQERSDAEVSRITRQVAQDVYSPYCPGQTLAMCPSANASFARQDIQEMARQGMSAEAITAEMIDRYGDEYALIEPSSQDQMWLVGAIIAGLIVAIIAVAILARRRRVDGPEEGTELGEGLQDGDGTDGGLDEDDPLLADLRAEYQD